MIDLQNLSFKYKNSSAATAGLRNINLKIRKGELVVICGESGCGKTTLTRVLNGLIPHYYEGELSGEYFIDGRPMRNAGLHDFTVKTGSVFQNPRSQFFNVDTDAELAFGCENMGMPAHEILGRMGRVIGEFRLQELMGRSLFVLSGGEKQKIACASVSAMEPEIFVLDEPTSNLDIRSINELKTIIEAWKLAGKTIIIAEHRLYWLQDIADRFIYMSDGEIRLQLPEDKFRALSETELHKMGLRALFSPENHGRAPAAIESGLPSEMIRIERFRCVFNKRPVLEIETLDLPRNKIIGVIGDNGAGKTTFMKTLCGLEKKSGGILKLDGKEYKTGKRIKLCYMVMQDVNHQLFTESVLEEVMLSDEDEDENAAEKILEDMNLLSKKGLHPMALSGGEKQRLAIASALASRKEIIVFDEPTSGLDYRHMKETSALFKELKSIGKSIFIVSHDPELIHSCCDYVVRMENGRIQGSTEPVAHGACPVLS